MAEAPAGGLSDLEKELTCSICTDILYQPLTLLDCLHTFCGSCLKDWFSFQASNATTPHPYTCPSCRASVRDTKRNAQVTTLLDIFLHANPGRAKSDAEKEELAKKYTHGQNVLRELDLAPDSEDEELMEEFPAIREETGADAGVGTEAMKVDKALHLVVGTEAHITTGLQVALLPRLLQGPTQEIDRLHVGISSISRACAR
ncbi:MAG: hypothetical protein Q9165_000303 [Trypethelium subeluteriae]